MVWEDDIEARANLGRIAFWLSCALVAVCLWLLITTMGLYRRIDILEGKIRRLEAGMSEPKSGSPLRGGGAHPQGGKDDKNPPVINPGSSLCDEEILAVIVALETSGNPEAVGAAGERGLTQFMPGTWEEATRRLYGRPLSFDLAFDEKTHLEVAGFHLGWLKSELKRSYELSSILAAWNAGPRRAEAAQFDMTKLPRSTREHIKKGKIILEKGGR